MNQISNLMKLQTSQQLRSSNILVQSMKNNIQQLNRSMSSIQKMIAQSRNIILESRQNSLSKDISHKKSIASHKNVIVSVSPRVEPPTIKKKKHPPIVNNQSNPASRIRGVASSRSFNYKSKFNKTASEHQLNLIKFQPETIKKQIQLRRSGVRDSKLSDSKKEQTCADLSQATPPRKQAKQIKLQNSPVSQSNSNKVYKFSPQRTSNQRAKPKIQLKETNNKIKLKPTPRHVSARTDKKPYIRLQAPRQPDMIKIEDDSYESDRNQQEYSQTQIKKVNKSVRFKTQYKQQEQDSVIYQYKLDSPSSEAIYHPKNIKPKGKISLKIDSHRKQFCQSYGQDKVPKNKTFIQTPRQNREKLVKQLQNLQTKSTNEEQRRAKFILKIRKYGFVEKYLNENEIWSIYDYLVGSQIPELKWPIYIVDEVYKKMKSLK